MNIKTDRLTIRPIIQEDIYDYYAIFSDPRVCEFDDFEPETRNTVEDTMMRMGAHTGEQEYAIIMDYGEKPVIGVLYVDSREERRKIGIHLNQAYTGRGFATETVRGMVNQGVTVKYEARIEYENENSRELFKRCGFSLQRVEGNEAVYWYR